MKRTLSVLLAVVFLLTAVPMTSISVSAATSGTTGECTWVLDDNGHLTISGNGPMGDYSTNSSIPWDAAAIATATIEPGVTSICNFAFWYSGLTSITIPDSVTSIGWSAFNSCANLTSVTIPNSVTSIRNFAFNNCSSLTTVNIGDGITSIGDSAFYSCDELTTVNIGNCVASIGDYAFEYCPKLTTVNIGNGITSIGDSAFHGCDGLTSVNITDVAAWCAIKFSTAYSNPLSMDATLYLNGEIVTHLTVPDGVTTIGEYAFYDCDSLISVTLPDSVTAIGDSAFSLCRSLTTITMPDSVVTIGASAFNGCTSLTSITIPGSVTRIGGSVFRRCESLVSVTIPDGVIVIGSKAFLSCTALTTVTIPVSIITIGFYAFHGCDALTDVYYDGDKDDRAAIMFEAEDSCLQNATWHYHEHVYDDDCDTDCNKCGDSRTAPHVCENSTDAICINCGHIRSIATIVTQPKSVCVAEGDIAEVTFEATGDDLTYQWYYAKPGTTKFYKTSFGVDNRYAIEMNSARSGYQVYCFVTDAYGNTVQTDTVTVNMLPHIYDNDYDPACNECGAIREVAIPTAFGGNSVSEDVSGLAFRFDVACEGMEQKVTTAIYDNATVDGYKLLSMGAVITNGVASVDVPAVYLFDLQEGVASYAVRLVNIPTDQYDRVITTTPYIVLEIDGVATTIYGEAQTCTYNEAIN